MNNDFNLVLNAVGQQNFPVELLEEMLTWNKIIKSPYGLSFYNESVGWDYKPDKSLRISDHWNFKTSNGKIHCCTTTPINYKIWAIGQFDLSIKKYIILKTFTTPKVLTKDTFIFNYYCLCYSYLKINKTDVNSDRVNFSFLNKSLRLFEKYSINPTYLSVY